MKTFLLACICAVCSCAVADTIQYGGDDPATAFKIERYEMTEKFERHDSVYPDAARFIIKDGAIEKEGKKRFLVGGWPLDTDENAWIMRTLGVDLYICNADQIYSLFTPKKDENGIPVLRWEENPWMHSLINRFLSNKVEFWLEHKSLSRYSVLKEDPRFNEYTNCGHFVPYDPFNPAGVDMYREFFKSMMRYTREYPIFCYEMFNEILYDNTHKISRMAFKEDMREKYGDDIEKANKAWGTSFASFDDVRVPGFMVDEDNPELQRETMRNEAAVEYPELHAEFCRYQRARCQKAFEKLMPIMRGYDPAPGPFRTNQSHMELVCDYGESGVSPEAMTSVSDFYTHEAGMGFVEGEKLTPANINKMSTDLFFYDAVRYFANGIPIINGESGTAVMNQTFSIDELRDSDVAALAGEWKFYDATEAEPKGWTAADFDDSAWAKITVPAMWGKCGFANCQVGIYRREFTIDEKELGKTLYLNGNSLADYGDIYVNGTHIGRSSFFPEPFTYDLSKVLVPGKNTIAIKIENHYFLDNMYYGGIRGVLAINHGYLKSQKALPDFEQRHIRSTFWLQAVRGLQGVVICYNLPMFCGAGRVIPAVRQELNNVADILFTRENRTGGECAVVYPEETMGKVRHTVYTDKIQGPATHELIPYYTGLLYGGYAPDVIRFRNLKDVKEQVKLLVAPDAERIWSEADMQVLRDYVAQGGNLFVNFNTITRDDEFHGAIDISDMLGFQFTGKLENPETLTYKGIAKGTSKTKLHFLDKSYGRTVKLDTAKAICSAGKFPLLTENRYGKGHVYCLTAQLEIPEIEKIVRAVAARCKVMCPIEVSVAETSAAPGNLDRAAFKTADGRILLYTSNFGNAPEYRFAPNAALLSSCDYTVRDVKTGKILASPSGKASWNASEIQKGFTYAEKRYDPYVLLLEPAGVMPLVLQGISPIRKQICEDLWRAKASVPGAPVVAISEVNGQDSVNGVVPTAWKLASDMGYNCKAVRYDDLFEGTDVLIWTYPRLGCAHAQEVETMVRNGGGVLLCGNAFLNWHNNSGNWNLWGRFGVAEGGSVRKSVLYNKEVSLPDFDNLTIKIPVADRTHPVLNRVDNVLFFQSNWLEKYPENATVLLRAPETSSNPGAVLAVAFEFGKGRVVVVSDYNFLRPTRLERGDNARFLANIINWLAKREGNSPTDEQIEASLFLTAGKLRQAEEQEKSEMLPPVYPVNTPNYMDSQDYIHGAAGGDMIIDTLYGK